MGTHFIHGGNHGSDGIECGPGAGGFLNAIPGTFTAFIHNLDRNLSPLLQTLHHFFDFMGGGLSSGSQSTHLIGNHSKTTTMLTGAGCFNRGVQRQQVGLFGDATNHINDSADITNIGFQAAQLLGGFFHFIGQRINRFHGFHHHLLAGLGFVIRVTCSICRTGCGAGDFLNGRSHFVHGSGHLGGFCLLFQNTINGFFTDGFHILRRRVQL